MYVNTSEVALAPRTDVESYNVQMNQATLDILSIVFEFKVATSWQITRFLTQKDQSKYLYRKLHRMWQAGLLESFKVYSGSRFGMPVYYMASKKGLQALEEQGKYALWHIQNYPEAKALLSWGSFKHEAEVVELASMEVKNKSQNFNITFKGEFRSGSYDFRSDKNIEIFTPDYTVFYSIGGREFCIYSEFERTPKAKEAMVRKIERYARHLNREQREHSTLRFIFETSGMEQSFWMNILNNQPDLLQKLKIVTTNIQLLRGCEEFLEPVYASESTIRLTKQGRLSVDTSGRIKLFPFL